MSEPFKAEQFLIRINAWPAAIGDHKTMAAQTGVNHD
jgi:hypothetical protein